MKMLDKLTGNDLKIIKRTLDEAVEAERAACQAIAHAWETDYQLKLTNGSASQDISKRRKPTSIISDQEAAAS